MYDQLPQLSFCLWWDVRTVIQVFIRPFPSLKEARACMVMGLGKTRILKLAAESNIDSFPLSVRIDVPFSKSKARGSVSQSSRHNMGSSMP